MKTISIGKLFNLVMRFGKLLACLGLVVFQIADKASAQGSFTASSGFSSIQGTNNWYYQQRPQTGGAATNLTWDAANGRWTGPGSPGLITSTDTHPGSSYDTIRKWVAPAAGNVAITGRVFKEYIGGGAGVVASVEKGGSVIWGPKTVAYNDGIGYTTDSELGSVTMTSGQSICFIVDDNGTYNSDWTGWNPTITYLPSYTASTGFSSIEGTNQWYYQQRPQIGGGVTNLTWDPINTRWTGPASPGIIASIDTHPGNTYDTIRKWSAPAPGVVSVSGAVYKEDTGGGAGIVANVEQNSTSIWLKTIAYNDAIGYRTDTSLGAVSVNSGDTLAFIVDDNGTYANDWTGWNPNIYYIGGSATTWMLNTSDTLMTLSIFGNSANIARLEDAVKGYNWVQTPLSVPMPNKIFIGATEYHPNWSYTSATVDTTSGTKLTLTFGSTTPSLLLTQTWCALPGAGPVEENTSITNNTGSTVTYNDIDVIGADLTVTSDSDVTLWRFDRASISTDGHITDTNFTTGVLKTALAATQTVSSEASNDYVAGTYELPFVMLDVPGTGHGLYIGYECDFGLFNTITAGNAHQIRNLFYLWNANSFNQATSTTLALPGVFFGAYCGNTEAGSNKMKNWFWNYKITPTIKSTPNEPLVEEGLNMYDYANCASELSSYPFASWGVELLKEDDQWTDDWSTHGLFGWDWSPNTAQWPNGMSLGSMVHNSGLKLSLYMANTYNNLDLSTTVGVNSEETALETRFNGTAPNFVAPGYDYWRSDIVIEAAYDYLSHLGFEQVLDYMISNHSGFRWENCSAGGSKKSFDLLKRQSIMCVDDDGYGPATVDDYRMAYYGNSYMINPVQLQSQNVYFSKANTTVEWAKYMFRIGFLGAWMHATGTANPLPGEGGNLFGTFQLATYQSHITLYETYQRPILRGADVYHILGICDRTNWDGIEFFNSARNKGSVVLFKPNSTVTTSPTLKLQGLIPTGTYSLTFQDRPGLTPSYRGLSGSTLSAGITVTGFTGTANDWDSEIIWINY